MLTKPISNSTLRYAATHSQIVTQHMEIIKPTRLKKYLKKELGKIESPQQALDGFVSFFHKYKLNPELEHEEEDMLLYQYGTYDWTGKGGNYEFNLTRQFEIPDDDEFLQLSLTLLFKPEIVGDLESDKSWSTDFEDLNKWTEHIKSTIGFKKVDGIKPDKFEIELRKT